MQILFNYVLTLNSIDIGLYIFIYARVQDFLITHLLDPMHIIGNVFMAFFTIFADTDLASREKLERSRREFHVNPEVY